jgi:triacylglycerol esterase/lipase EstA (alpha/beta hydrolase family)
VLPTIIVPGYLESAIAYLPLEKFLQQQGFPVATVPLRRRDWVPTVGGRSMVPILRQIDLIAQQMREKHKIPQINLIGHSAGGWIARIYLGEKPYTIHGDVREDVKLWEAHTSVASLTTLGTPHTSLERWTRKNLDFVNQNYPGAFYPKVRYTCVAGKSVYGQRRSGNWLAYSSYKLTCGDGHSWGDGITPISAALLPGANHLILEGVKHSPRSPGLWYGSPTVVKEWVKYLL